MLDIQLYSFKKRLNSLKIPNPQDATTVQGELKDSFTLTGFSVKFAFDDPAQVPAYNYARIDALSRYYFITDWFYSGGFWSAQFAVDVLASNRAEILASEQYVSRAYAVPTAPAQYTRPMMIDAAYPTVGEAYNDSTTLYQSQMWGNSVNGGIIVLGVICSDTQSIGAVTYYGMEASAFSGFMHSMLSSISWAGISSTEISEQLQKALLNPTQYIVSCQWFPFSASDLPTSQISVGDLKLGWWTFQVNGLLYLIDNIPAAIVQKNGFLEIPKHRSHTDNNRAYLQLAPYSNYNLYFPPFGSFELDSTELANHSHIYIKTSTSLLTGDTTFSIETADYNAQHVLEPSGVPFFRYTGNLGVPLAIGQIAGDIGNYKNALVAGAAAGIAELGVF